MAVILFHYMKYFTISVLCVPPDLREIVFVIQSQSNSFHVRQAESLRAELLKQALSLREVRFMPFFTDAHMLFFLACNEQTLIQYVF